jgi:hypothetical protein
MPVNGKPPAHAQARSTSPKCGPSSRRTRSIAARAPNTEQSGGRKLPVGRIDDDAHRRKGKAMRGREPRHHVGFHIDRGRAGLPVQLALLRRLGDRSIDAHDRSVHGSRDHAQELARPGRIRRPHVL